MQILEIWGDFFEKSCYIKLKLGLKRLLQCNQIETVNSKQSYTVDTLYSEDLGSRGKIHYIVNLHYIVNPFIS